MYGLYSALFCGEKGQSVLVLECDPTPFRRATYINQARVHQGYHYPRLISTAMKSAGYFERFNVKPGDNNYLIRVSSDYFWDIFNIDTVIFEYNEFALLFGIEGKDYKKENCWSTNYSDWCCIRVDISLDED